MSEKKSSEKVTESYVKRVLRLGRVKRESKRKERKEKTRKETHKG
jgi:hypothetical protein